MAPEERVLPNHDIVAIGASAGGLSALKRIVAGLPAGFDAAVLVAQHMKSDQHSELPAILEHAGPLPAGFAEDGGPATRGRIHVAPPNHHLLLRGDTLRLSYGTWENGVRPSIDTLFRSVAVCCGSRSIGGADRLSRRRQCCARSGVAGRSPWSRTRPTPNTRTCRATPWHDGNVANACALDRQPAPWL
ncbi:chemotaxis protein CheB [Inquilinus sp. OTU3971]|uniref:chemotaxis protein CheB n=1 Tax=Inquilinus sp. OTU3971 TaxID=3043855 RepID=UPI00313F10C7